MQNTENGFNNKIDRSGKKNIVQFIKFGLVGVSNTVVDMVVNIIVTKVLELFTGAGWITYAAKTVGYCAGVLNSYALNSRWTFKEERKKDKREKIAFILVNLFVYAISIAFIWLFTSVLHLDAWWESLGMPEWLTNIIGGRLFCSLLATVICIFINFILNKLFVFKGEKTEDSIDTV